MIIYSSFFLFFFFYLTVVGESGKREDSPPRITEHPLDVLVPKSSPAQMTCRAEGHPAPTIYVSSILKTMLVSLFLNSSGTPFIVWGHLYATRIVVLKHLKG